MSEPWAWEVAKSGKAMSGRPGNCYLIHVRTDAQGVKAVQYTRQEAETLDLPALAAIAERQMAEMTKG